MDNHVMQTDGDGSGVSAKSKLTNEKLLMKRLIDNYPQKIGRPVLNDTDGPVKYTLKCQLFQIINLDPGNQVFVTNIWNTFVSSIRKHLNNTK